jgi:hypothetical protein
MLEFRHMAEMVSVVPCFPYGTTNQLLMYHHTPEGTVHNFINTTALTSDWHNDTVPDHELHLIVRRLPDDRIHARTQSLKYMNCQNDQCDATPTNTIDKRANKAIDIEDIDFSWAEPAGYGTKPHSGVEDAA